MTDKPTKFAMIACRVFEEEINLHIPQGAPIGPVEYFELGLHDRPKTMRSTLQAAVDSFNSDDSLTAVLLVYGLCGRGTAGLRAGRHPLVIPRAHDCMTVFMGSAKTYIKHQAAHPDSYYFTPGWMRDRRTPGPERLELIKQELSQKFDPEDVEFLVETERDAWAQHGRAVFIDLATMGADAFAERAAQDAKWLGWQFERICGNPSLLQDLLSGNWDEERFQIVSPGNELRHMANDKVFASAPAE